MQRVEFGATGMRLTKVGFGGIPIQRLSDEEAQRLVSFALDSGINWIDTAAGYGSSEERIGGAVAGRDRSEIFLFTKSGAKDPGTLKRDIQRSLTRLRVDYLDLFQFHLVPDPETWERMLADVPPGTYQNGGYWSTPSGWVAMVIDRYDPATARAFVDEVIDELEVDNAPEWINEDTVQAPLYVAGAANVLAAVKSA